MFLVGFACCADRCGSSSGRLEILYLEKQCREMQNPDSVRWFAVARCIVLILRSTGADVLSQPGVQSMEGTNKVYVCCQIDIYYHITMLVEHFVNIVPARSYARVRMQ